MNNFKEEIKNIIRESDIESKKMSLKEKISKIRGELRQKDNKVDKKYILHELFGGNTIHFQQKRTIE